MLDGWELQHIFSRSAEVLGESEEESSRSADVAEPVDVFVLDDFGADELRTVLPEAAKRVVDVVDLEHDPQITEGVHRRIPVIGDDGRVEEA
jgi:hypothetical protein